jgi:Lipase (class 3)
MFSALRRAKSALAQHNVDAHTPHATEQHLGDISKSIDALIHRSTEHLNNNDSNDNKEAHPAHIDPMLSQSFKEGIIKCSPAIVNNEMFMAASGAVDLAALAYNTPQDGTLVNVSHPADEKSQSISVREYVAPERGDFLFSTTDLTTPYFIATSEDTLYVVWRGTTDIADWAKNISFEMIPLKLNGRAFGEVHVGFLAAYLQHPNFLSRFAAAVQSFGDIKPKLVVAGHSLGGAAAQICAFDLSLQAFESQSGDAWHFTPTVFTFGSPRIANMHLRDEFGKRVVHYRFMNNHDVVPSVPPFGPVQGKDDWDFYWHTGDASIMYTGDPADNVHYACFNEAISFGHQRSIADHSVEKNYKPKTNVMAAFGARGEAATRAVMGD